MTHRVSIRRLLLALGAGLVAVAFSGCATRAVSYKTRPELPAKLQQWRTIVVAPPDVEVREISAGGVAEKRDDWSQQVAANLRDAVAAATGFPAVRFTSSTPQEEIADVRALMRLITLNHVSYLFAQEQLSSSNRPLTYSLGRISPIVGPWNPDAVLFLFARDAYSSAGRKTLVALGFANPAPAVASAMLVARDGTVHWFNYHFAPNTDLREPAGAAALAQALLEGLPRK